MSQGLYFNYLDISYGKPEAQGYDQIPILVLNIGIPSPNDTKHAIPKFTGKEKYQGFGTGFKEW